MQRWKQAMVAAVLLFAPLAVFATDRLDTELAHIEAMIVDVGLRADVRGLELARQRTRALLEAHGDAIGETRRARALRALALADFNVAMSTAGDIERAADAARRMHATLEDAVAIAPDDAELWFLLNRSEYMLLITDAANLESIVPRMQESATKAREADSGHPLVTVLDALDLLYPEGGADVTRGHERMKDAIAALAREEGPIGRFWYLLITNFRAQALLSQGAIIEAHDTIRRLLEERPDYWLVRETLLPMTAPARVADPPEVAQTAWTELARDPRGDGRSAKLPDARSLSYHYDADADWLWFRIGLHGTVDPASIGINLPVDIDGSQETGSAWWGGNTAFRWDRLVTVWIARTEDGRYRGATGMGDTRGAAEGRYVNLANGNVVTAFDETSLYIGFPRADLTDERRLKLIGVVGSNTRWNDPLPDRGLVTLDLDDR